MRICIIGAPGSGKTIFSQALGLLLRKSHAIVHGDDFISEELFKKDDFLSAISHKNVIIEHPLSLAHALDLSVDIDLLFVIRPDKEEWEIRLSNRCAEEKTYWLKSEMLETLERIENEQIDRAKRGESKIIIASGLSDGLKKFAEEYWTQDILDKNPEMIVFKVSDTCNLECDYCYMFQHFDKIRSKDNQFATPDIGFSLGARIREFLQSKPDDYEFDLVYHGGEPLMMGKKRLIALTESILEGLKDYRHRVRFCAQTNGTLVNRELLDTLDSYGFHLGFSLDGITEKTNRHRPTKKGVSSAKTVIKNYEAAKSFQWTKGGCSGILSVIDPKQKGSSILNELVSISAPKVDFLFPDLNWDSPSVEQVDKFLIDIFDDWVKRKDLVGISFFKSAIEAMAGRSYQLDSFGIGVPSIVFVDHRGNYEVHSVLRTNYSDAWVTSNNINNCSITEYLNSNRMLNYWQNALDYSDKCVSCRYFLACGAGYMPHRFSKARGYNNPSVYCQSLLKIFEKIENFFK